MATTKDRLEKLELEMQELKEGMQKMIVESQSNFRELRELFSKSLERGESSAAKENGLVQIGSHSPIFVSLESYSPSLSRGASHLQQKRRGHSKWPGKISPLFKR